MIIPIISSIVILMIYLYIGTILFDRLTKENSAFETNQTSYFYIIYFILFLILVNVYLVVLFNSKIMKKKGPVGPVGIKGNMGPIGESGSCDDSCFDQTCKKSIIEVIQSKYNLLLEKEGKQSISIKKDITNPETGIVYKTNLKNNMLNEMVEALCDSKQYKQSLNSQTGVNNGKTVQQVESYVHSIFEKWIELIYNSLEQKSRTSENEQENFFLDENATNDNTEWKEGENPFDKMAKYDIYSWGMNRIFKPLHIKIDTNPNNVNYAPKTAEPPLKILHTNNYKMIYDNQLNNSVKQEALLKKDKYPNNKFSIWENLEPITYRNEEYYPIGNLVSNIAPTKKNKWTKRKIIVDPKDKYSKVNTYKYSGKEDTTRKNKVAFTNPSKSNILITGDIETPVDYYKLWDNKNSYERNNVSIWRPKCPDGYKAMSDVAVKGFENPLNNEQYDNIIKCVPEKCLERNTNKPDVLFKTYDKNEILGYGKKDGDIEPSGDNSYNTFRYKNKKNNNNEEDGDFYKIKDICFEPVINKNKNVESNYSRIGLGWNGRPVRNPKYSIFSYLVMMPEAIISNKATNFKYYIIHTELYNTDSKFDANFKNSAKNLYYILVLNNNNNRYDRCLSTNGEEELVRTELKSELESYWELEHVNKEHDEIRLKSAKTGNYFYHDRNPNLRRDIVKNRVFEKQLKPDDINDETEDNITFVNIKSALGTNIETALEDGEPRKEEKYYNRDDIKTNKYRKDYEFKERGIKR